MKLVLGALAAVTLIAAAAPASAQIALEANGARSEGQWGAEFGAGYSVVNIGGFSLTPGAGLFVYDRDTDGYGEIGTDAQCRRLDTGAAVNEDRCDDTGTKLYGRVEASYTLPIAGISIGTGARLFSGDLRPYGTVAVPLAPLFKLKANAGPKYLAAGLAARF